MCRSPIVSVKGIFVIKNKKAWLSKKETVAHFCGTVSFVGAFSLNKPLVLPVVGKNTIVNKNLAVIIEMVWRPHH